MVSRLGMASLSTADCCNLGAPDQNAAKAPKISSFRAAGAGRKIWGDPEIAFKAAEEEPNRRSRDKLQSAV
jgi:hypothetical protein